MESKRSALSVTALALATFEKVVERDEEGALDVEADAPVSSSEGTYARLGWFQGHRSCLLVPEAVA